MLETRLTQAFGLKHPVISAPMAVAGGGRLAAAVTRAGGLGLIGGGYCDQGWIADQFAEAGNAAGAQMPDAAPAPAAAAKELSADEKQELDEIRQQLAELKEKMAKLGE